MSVALRLSRGGSKKRPYYRIVVANSRAPRDGKYLEQVGTYNPLLAKDNTDRVRLTEDRIRYWLSVGAQPTDRVARLLDTAGIKERVATHNPKAGEPGKKAKDRAEDKAKKVVEAEEAAREAAAAPVPVVENVVEEVVEEAAPVAEEAMPVEAPVETPSETPAETPVEAPEVAPVESPVEAPVEAPIEQPAEVPVPQAAEIHSATPDAETGDSAVTPTGETAQNPAEG